MTESDELRTAKRKWTEIEQAEELRVYKLLLEELEQLPGDWLQTYEEGRVLPKLAVVTFQLREHSRSLLRWTIILACLTSVLAVLTAVLIAIQIR